MRNRYPYSKEKKEGKADAVNGRVGEVWFGWGIGKQGDKGTQKYGDRSRGKGCFGWGDKGQRRLRGELIRTFPFFFQACLVPISQET